MLEKLIHYATCLLVLLSLSACTQTTAAPQNPHSTSAESPSFGQPASLLIRGYNYTDHFIDSYTVNGQGGGNVFESGPTSGGGKDVCCMSYLPGTPLPIKLTIRWTANYCMVYGTTKYGEAYKRRINLWKETEALITEPPAGKPETLEIHFYPDGHVEAAITESASFPRLILQRDADYNRPGVSQNFPRCTDEQLRSQY